MSGPPTAGRPQDAWPRALAGVAALSAAVGELHADYAALLGLLADALADPIERGPALHVLSYLDEDYTIALADRLVAASLSHRDALAVREVLGRLSWQEAARVVPPAVWAQLDETGDDDAYRRLAELLRHLGLTEALRRLCQRALASDDPDVREVGEDFAAGPT